MKKRIVILGSTGSIGESALDVIAKHPDRFEILGLVAGSNEEKLKNQVKKFRPKISVVGKKDPEGVIALAAHPEADLVLSAIVGAAGLKPTYHALKAGKVVALANKESLVAAGSVMTETAKEYKGTLTLVSAGENIMKLARKNNVDILPIDSEHSAIHQALRGFEGNKIQKVIITASGGPFRGWTAKQLETVTVEAALKHPKWSMGNKITIDSATMMNKGLEVIEAKWLFDLPPEKIEVVIHPQSIVHSLVEYIDGSVMAQLGVPDMRTPIAYALAYPDRVDTDVVPFNLAESSPLTFEKPDEKTFVCLRLARQALNEGKSYATVLNAANEIAVYAFLDKKIEFTKIPEIIEKTLDAHSPIELRTLEDVLESDRWAREYANKQVG